MATKLGGGRSLTPCLGKQPQAFGRNTYETESGGAISCLVLRVLRVPLHELCEAARWYQALKDRVNSAVLASQFERVGMVRRVLVRNVSSCVQLRKPVLCVLLLTLYTIEDSALFTVRKSLRCLYAVFGHSD
jgi:hypothetical protein